MGRYWIDWFLEGVYLSSDPTAPYQVDAFLHESYQNEFAAVWSSTGTSTTDIKISATLVGGGSVPGPKEVWSRWWRRQRAKAKPAGPVEGWTSPVFTTVRLRGVAGATTSTSAVFGARARFSASAACGSETWMGTPTVHVSREKFERDLVELLILDAA